MIEPREFWIYSREADYLFTATARLSLQSVKNIKQWHGSEVREYHVIEKLAVDKLVEAIKIHIEDPTDWDILFDALEEYKGEESD